MTTENAEPQGNCVESEARSDLADSAPAGTPAETPKTVHVACRHLEIYTQPPGADVFVDLRILGWVHIGKTGVDTPAQWDYQEIVEWDAEKSTWAIPEFFLSDGNVNITLSAGLPDYGDAVVRLVRAPEDFQYFSDPPDVLAAQGKIGKCPEANPAYTSAVTIVITQTMKYAIAWYYLKVYSDPPGAHIYNAQDNSYWGKTGLDKPVFIHLALPVMWNEQGKKWTWKDPHFVGGCHEATVIARRVGYSDAKQTLRIPSTHFTCFPDPPDELTAQGKLGRSDQPNPSNTSEMMIVLQSGAGDVLAG
ncbi:hypothetical protein SKC41_19655 [Mycobacterium sp. 050128]|uniref:hypothetical protein n=1 Tax=Mycobacterium sp. 050128 TaxID=3096112 RepID=UPI002EDB0316